MIKNIIFDIGRVLIDFEWFDYMDRLFDKETAHRVTEAMWGTGYWKELDKALLTNEEILDLFYSAGPDVKDEIYEAYDRVGECVVRRDWAIPFIDDLKEQGYRVLYLSNFSEHVMGSNREALDFVDHMDGGVFSCDVNVIKPAPDIYKIIIDKYDLVPEECLFIDDHADNVAMAKKCGMKGIVFESYEQLSADLGKSLTKDRGHDRISVLCYGDSNTYGYEPATGGRYASDKRWTNILSDMLGDRYEVIAEGLNGRTAGCDRPGAAWKNGASSFTACLATHKPVDYLVIMLGTNDCIDELGQSAADIADGMETLVKMTEENTPGLQGYIPEIIVVSPPAVQGDIDGSPFAGEFTPTSIQKSRDIEALYHDIAEKHLARYVSATYSADVVRWDCIHLSEQGHRDVAELIYEEITRDASTYDVELPFVQ